MKVLLITIIILTTMTTTARDTTLVLQYLVREPKIKSEHPPVLILLHGVGSNEADLFSLADQLPDKYLVISARAPISLGVNSFAWFQVDFSTGKPVFNIQQEENSRATLIKFITQIKEKYAVDSNEIYLCGFSQGGIMSYSIGLTRTDLVKGIAVMSGRLLEEIRSSISKNNEVKQLNIFIAHGIQDNTLSVQYAREAKLHLENLGLRLSYHEYNMGHQINSTEIQDLNDWLSQ